MALRKVETGPVGLSARRNIARLRQERNFSLRQLSEELSKKGRPISYTGISQIENGGRRIDVDDLVAFADALNVSIADLINEGTGDDPFITGYRAGIQAAQQAVLGLSDESAHSTHRRDA